MCVRVRSDWVGGSESVGAMRGAFPLAGVVGGGRTVVLNPRVLTIAGAHKGASAQLGVRAGTGLPGPATALALRNCPDAPAS